MRPTMRPTTRPTMRPLAATLLGLALLAAAGCGEAAEQVAEKATERAIESQGGDGAKVDIGDDGTFAIETEDGSYSAGTGEVPKGWPDDVPLPSDLEIATGTDIGSGGQTISSVIGTTGEDPAAVDAFYAEALAAWEEASRVESTSDGSSLVVLAYTSGERTVQLTVTEDADDVTTLSISHATESAP